MEATGDIRIEFPWRENLPGPDGQFASIDIGSGEIVVADDDGEAIRIDVSQVDGVIATINELRRLRDQINNKQEAA